MGEVYIKGAYSTVIGHRSLGSHEHRDWLFEKEDPCDKLLVIWLISKYGHYQPSCGLMSNVIPSSMPFC